MSFGMFYAFNVQIEFKLMVFWLAVVFRSSIGKDTQQRYGLSFKERQHTIVQKIGCSKGIFAIIHLGKSYPRVGINKGLLVDTAYTFNVTYIIGVLRSQVARVFGFNLSMGFSLFLLSF